MIELKNPERAALGLLTSANKYVAQVGTSRFPNPNERDAAKMKRSFLVILRYDKTLIPDAITEANRNYSARLERHPGILP